LLRYQNQTDRICIWAGIKHFDQIWIESKTISYSCHRIGTSKMKYSYGKDSCLLRYQNQTDRICIWAGIIHPDQI